MARLAGKTALVTGASRGIGRAIALALAKEGAAVAVNYRVSEIEARQVVEQLSRFGMPEEIAKAVLFLAADADYVTGQQIDVNRGVYM